MSVLERQDVYCGNTKYKSLEIQFFSINLTLMKMKRIPQKYTPPILLYQITSPLELPRNFFDS